MIVYKVDVTDGILYVADPNYPGNRSLSGNANVRKILYSNNKFDTYGSKSKADGPEIGFDQIAFFGKTANIEWSQITKRYQELKSETIDLYTVVNIEMIGVPFTDRDYDAFLTGYDNSNMAAKINEYVGYKLIGFSEVSKKYNLFKASDNYPFYEVFKLPSHTISSCDLSNYDHYHQVGDEANKQNYEHMASLVNKLIPAVEAICNTPTKEIALNDE